MKKTTTKKPTRTPRPSRLLQGLSVFALVGAVAALFWVVSAEEPAPAADRNDNTAGQYAGNAEDRVPASEAGEVVHETPTEWTEEPFAASLEGTAIDGQLRADDQGRLILDLGVKDLFDYFLNTVGEVPAEEAIDQIRDLAESHLPETAAGEAITLLDQYLEYKQRAVTLKSQPLDAEESQSPEQQIRLLEQGLVDMKRIRRETMAGDAVQAFFSDQEAYGDYTLERFRVRQRNDLSPEERQQRVRLAREELPAKLRETDQQLHDRSEQQQAVMQVMNEAGSPEEAASQLRAMDVPEERVNEVVSRMSDQQRFDGQYESYKRERDELLASGYSEADRDRELDALRESHFDSQQHQSMALVRDREAGDIAN